MKNVDPKQKTIDDYFTAEDIHDVQRETSGGVVTFVVALLAAVAESLLLYWLFTDKISPTIALLFHAIVIFVLMLYARVAYNGRESRFALLLLLTTIMASVFGAVGTMVTILLQVWFLRRSIPFAEWFGTIFPHVPQSSSQRIYQDLLTGRDESDRSYSVIPFLDVLSFGNEAQKRQALAKMTSNFHPNFAPAFRRALNDPSNMIRVQAATAITKIESQFMDRAIKLSLLKDEYPNDPVVIRAMAEHYDDYAYTGLLDADREQDNRRKALEYYNEYLLLKPRDADVSARIARILMRNREYDKACDWCRQCIDQGLVTQALSQWYSEALFASGRYDQLRRYRAGLPAAATASNFQPGLQEALALWGGKA